MDETAVLQKPRAAGTRLVGSAFFALVAGGYLWKAADFTIPRIIAASWNLDGTAAQAFYDSNGVCRVCALLVTALATAVGAAFLARGRGIVAALLANSLYIAVICYLTFAGPESAPILLSSYPVAIPSATFYGVEVCLLLLVTISGGLLGARLWSAEEDLDLGKDKVTVFGVRWWHYIWILPAVYYGYLSSVIMLVFAAARCLWVDLSFAWHPSLWFSFSAWILLSIGLALVNVGAFMTAGGLLRFYAVMQYGRGPAGWGRFWRALLYGIGAPTLSYTVGSFASDAALGMPRPAAGDWKVVVAIVAIIVVVSIASMLGGKVGASLRRRRSS